MAIDVRNLTREGRKLYGLSTSDTIIEVVGDQPLVEEAVAYARKKRIAAFDLETTGLDPHTGDIVLVQLGDEERQYLLWYSTIDPEPITELLADKNVCKAGVNLNFDLMWWLVKHGLDKRCWNPADAQLVEQVLCCGLTGGTGQTLKMTGMGPMAKRWLNLDLPKDEDIRTGWGNMLPGNWTLYRDGTPIPDGEKKRHYAADDVIIPLQLLSKQKPWIKEFQLTDTVNLEHAFLSVLAEIQARGIKLDTQKWAALAEEAAEKVQEAELELDKLFDVTVTVRIDQAGNAYYERDKNYTSPDQLKTLIREYMLQKHNIEVICTNQDFEDTLRGHGRANPARLDKLFLPHQIPDPEKPGKKKKVGYGNMTDTLDQFWDLYRPYLPTNCFRLPDTDSKTLLLNKIIWETPEQERDWALPNRIGLPPELVDPLIELRKHSKNKSTYGLSWFDRLSPTTGRIHASFLQAALDTGRLSNSPSTMNLPKDQRYRDCFISDTGKVFVGRDWSQIEPRVIAQLSKDPTYMRVFWSEFRDHPNFRKWCGDDIEYKLDLYVEVGKNVGILGPQYKTKKDCEGDEEGKAGRHQSKTIVLGLGYGTGVTKFWHTLMRDTGKHCSLDYATKLHRGFWRSVPDVKDALDTASALARPGVSKRCAYHPFANCEVTWAESFAGRKRFFHPDATSWWSQGRNAVIQSTAGGDILKQTAILFARWLWEQEIDGGIVNLVHDEIIVEVPEKEAERVSDKLEEMMTYVGEHYLPDVPVTSDGTISTFWKK